MFCFANCAVLVQGQTKKSTKWEYGGFSGGMLLHTGYVYSQRFDIEVNGVAKTFTRQGAPFGLGGRLQFAFGKHLRIGGEGYSSVLYFKNKSYCQTGWGGILADFIWRKKVVSPFVGFTFGGGTQKTLILSDSFQNQFITENIFYHRFGFLVLTPFVGMEITITPKVRFVLKADYIFNVSNPQKDFITGVRLYAGVWFYTKM